MIVIRNYTNEELEYIKNNYNNMTIKELSAQINKSESSISNAIRKLGLIKQVHNKWSEEENQYLTDNYEIKTAEEIATYLNRTTASVIAQVDRLGLTKQSKWSENEIIFLTKNFDKLSHKEIGKQLNRTQGAITAKCFDLGLYKKELPWEEWELDFLKESYMEMCTSDIARLLNRTESAVSIKASRCGLKKYPYFCDYHYFDMIDTEEKAYWLGFLTADGWVNKSNKTGSGVVGVELQYGDINHFKKFNKSINGNYQIADRWRECKLSKYSEKHHSCILRIFSLTMYDALCNLGFTNEKSFDGFIPPMNSNLIRHYMRGYFDGDGCFTYTNKSFHVSFCTSSKVLSQDIIDIMAKENIEIQNKHYTTEYGTEMYIPFICKNEFKIKFLNWIYQDCNIYLDRKYKKYLKVLSKYNKT